MCRSGNHCIIYWMLDNLGGIKQKYEGSAYWNHDTRVYYYNNCSRYAYDFIHNYNTLIKSYEDVYYNKSRDNIKHIIILRDFLNMASSRFKKYKPKFGLDRTYLESIEQIIILWKILANSIIYDNDVIGILYNKWILDKSYRDEIGEKVGITNINDKTDEVPEVGEGSSFNGVNLEIDKNIYNERYKMVNLPEDVIDKILSDQDLLYLNKKLFDIDIKEILNGEKN